MYAYLVDTQLQDRKYQAELFRIESRLAQLGIQGRLEKITILKNLQETAREVVRRGATTLVAVGNDQTVTKLLPISIEKEITLGLIPLGEPQTIANFLGIPVGLAACDVLSRRVVRKLDVGQVDSQYFLLQARLSASAAVQCDGKYTVESLDPNGAFVIGNLGHDDPYGQPNDGRLELIVEPAKAGWSWSRRTSSAASVFPIRKATIKGPSAQTTILLDGQILIKSPSSIEVAAKKLGMIVGRTRQF